jgi:hypothetical protein
MIGLKEFQDQIMPTEFLEKFDVDNNNNFDTIKKDDRIS